jgi:hypothetical protein
MPICTCNTPVLGASASIMGSELSVCLTLAPFRAALRSYTYNTGNTATRCLPDGHGEGR